MLNLLKSTGTTLDTTKSLLYSSLLLTNSTQFHDTRPPSSKPPKHNSSKDSKTHKWGFTTHTYPRDPREDFVFISAKNESDLDEIISLKCNQSDEMEMYFGELENKCIYIIFCCGPNKHPEKNVEYMPRRNGLAN